MTDIAKYIVGTSGYSFADWVGTFYPAGTRSAEMLDYYVRHFRTVEVNYTFYRMPAARTLAGMASRSPQGFTFWLKANQETTHKQNRSIAREFIDNLQPLLGAGKLAGVLLQFPQSFHRTVANRKYLAAALDDLGEVHLAVEFRHCSWEHQSVNEGLRDRGVTIVIPDAPAIDSLYHSVPAVTSRVGYIRLHSRAAHLWHAGAAERYNYSYSRQELTDILQEWSALEDQTERVFAFFNNCHRGQAAQNAEAFRRILGQVD